MIENKFNELVSKIKTLRLHSEVSFLFILFLREIDLPEKKVHTFLKLDRSKSIGYLYRLVISSAYKYGVPQVYIKDSIDKKNSYKKVLENKYYKDIDVLRYKMNMVKSYNNLIKATLQMISEKKSRKEKINKILEKIGDRN